MLPPTLKRKREGDSPNTLYFPDTRAESHEFYGRSTGPSQKSWLDDADDVMTVGPTQIGNIQPPDSLFVSNVDDDTYKSSALSLSSQANIGSFSTESYIIDPLGLFDLPPYATGKSHKVEIVGYILMSLGSPNRCERTSNDMVKLSSRE